jgi:hypothetical protein
MTTDVGADSGTNFDDVYRRVIHEIGTGKVVVVHHDNMFNNNGLKWNNPRGVVNVKIPECGRNGAADAIAKLDDAEFLITGTTKAACLVDFDQQAVESAAQQKGFTQVAELELGPENTVRIWRR